MTRGMIFYRFLYRFLPHPFKLLKRWVPASFLGRSLLIVITPVVVIQAISSYVFLRSHWEKTTQALALGIAGDIAVASRILETAPPPNAGGNMRTFLAEKFDLEITSGQPQEAPYTPWPFQSRLERALKQKLGAAYILRVTPRRGYVWVSVPHQGSVCFSFSTKRLFSPSTALWLFCSLGASLFFALLASFFMRRQAISLDKLVFMAQGLEDGKPIRPQRFRGALEIRRIAHLFFIMQRRLLDKMEEQTTFLAGISHDLRTPLTRMRLQLSLMPTDPDVQDLQRDVEDMIHMVEEYLDFIRQEAKDSPQTKALEPFLSFVCKSFVAPKLPLHLRVPDDSYVFVQPSSLRRCVQNLIENALRYGRTQVSVSVWQNENTVSLVVDDDGPGIPQEFRQAVFKPFFRMDSGRNLQTGGTGLGLAIVDQLMTKMGGKAQLEASPQGGVRAVLLFPIPDLNGKPVGECGQNQTQ